MAKGRISHLSNPARTVRVGQLRQRVLPSGDDVFEIGRRREPLDDALWQAMESEVGDFVIVIKHDATGGPGPRWVVLTKRGVRKLGEPILRAATCVVEEAP